MTSPDDLLRSVRPQRPPMPDHVRRAVDARLSEAAWREMHRIERHESFDVGTDEEGDDAVVAHLDDFRAVPGRRRGLPVVAAVVALLVGAVGVAAMTVDRGVPEPAATSVARPAPGTADDRPFEPAATPAAPTPMPTVTEPAPAIDPDIEAVLAGLPTAGLAPDRLDVALAGIDAPAAGTADEVRRTTTAVVAGVACAWVGHWHDAVANGDVVEADRAVAVFADLDRWTALDGPGLATVTHRVAEVADVVIAAGPSPADPGQVAASVRPLVCDA